MKLIIKNLIISILIGIIGFVIVDYFYSNTFSVPDTTDISPLLVIIAAVFAGILLAGAGRITEGVAFDMDDERELGTVKWFNVKKGYGFITRDQGDDVFVHYRNIKGQGRRAIAEGQRVEFCVISSDKGLQADEVEPV